MKVLEVKKGLPKGSPWKQTTKPIMKGKKS